MSDERHSTVGGGLTHDGNAAGISHPTHADDWDAPTGFPTGKRMDDEKLPRHSKLVAQSIKP